MSEDFEQYKACQDRISRIENAQSRHDERINRVERDMNGLAEIVREDTSAMRDKIDSMNNKVMLTVAVGVFLQLGVLIVMKVVS